LIYERRLLADLSRWRGTPERLIAFLEDEGELHGALAVRISQAREIETLIAGGLQPRGALAVHAFCREAAGAKRSRV
jgi:hypothetical protein